MNRKKTNLFIYFLKSRDIGPEQHLLVLLGQALHHHYSFNSCSLLRLNSVFLHKHCCFWSASIWKHGLNVQMKMQLWSEFDTERKGITKSRKAYTLPLASSYPKIVNTWDMGSINCHPVLNLIKFVQCYSSK